MCCVCLCSRLRTLLKTAKKKLRDQDVGAAEFLSPSSSLRMEHGRHSQADGRVQDRVGSSDAETRSLYTCSVVYRHYCCVNNSLRNACKS